MKNHDVINLIDRLLDSKMSNLVFNATEVFAVVVHGYYYIKPGKNTKRFFKKINRVFKKGVKEARKMSSETKNGIACEEWIWGKMASEAIVIARSMFDEEFYLSQIERMNVNEKYDESLLKNYLYQLSSEDLVTIFDGIMFYFQGVNAFMSDEGLVQMMEEFEVKFLGESKVDPNHVRTFEERTAIWSRGTAAVFGSLGRESVIDTIYKHIEKDRILLAHMIKAFVWSDVDTASKYTVIALTAIRDMKLVRTKQAAYREFRKTKFSHSFMI